MEEGGWERKRQTIKISEKSLITNVLASHRFHYSNNKIMMQNQLVLWPRHHSPGFLYPHSQDKVSEIVMTIED